jgi:hypothetical protein
MALWFFISVPLTFLGAFLGFKKSVVTAFLTHSRRHGWLA